MRGPQPRYPIELTADEKNSLSTWFVRRQRHRQRRCEQDSCFAPTSILSRAISRSRQPVARRIEPCANGAADGVRHIRWLTRPDQGRRGVFPPETRAHATALACSLPKQEQVPLSRWSRTELAHRGGAEPTLAGISASTVGRWLKAERLRPWRYHAWQHIHDPASFLERARPVLEAYAQAAALLQAGTWLLCLDEKTSIQAREAEHPPRPAHPGKPILQEARYHRRGARHLFAGLSVADGQVYGSCRLGKCFVDFQAFVQQEILPEALRRQVQTIAFILDNGPTHAPKQRENWLHEQEQHYEGQLPFQVYWLPVNASWLDQIEIWFSLLQRKCLQPNHFVSTDTLEAALIQ